MNNVRETEAEPKQTMSDQDFSTACAQLAHTLSTDSSLLTFLWAWWRVGRQDGNFRHIDAERLLGRGFRSPLKHLVKIAYFGGRRGVSWPEVLTVLGQPIEPQEVV